MALGGARLANMSGFDSCDLCATYEAPISKRRKSDVLLLACLFMAFQLLVFLLASFPAPAQAPQNSAPPTTLRSETHAILISVSVRDSSSHPVENLRKEDFTITDNGRRRDFQLLASDASLSQRPVALPVGVFSNRFGAAAPTGRSTAILIDAVNTPVEDQAFAREQAIKAVENLKSGDSVAIYELHPQLTVLQDYTTDRDALLAAVKNFRPQQSIWLTQAAAAASSGGISAAQRTIPSAAQSARATGSALPLETYYLERRIETTTDTLLAIATHMSGATHRNSILWITGGFPVNFDSNPRVQAALRAVNDANVAIYPIDARGILISGIDENIQVMQGFADETGGQAYAFRNDVSHAIDEALADPDSTYLLGFYLTDSDLDGRFHKLHVRVDRPGLSLHYRNGYTAAADANSSREKAEPIETALLTTQDSAGIAMDARITRQKEELKISLTLDRNSFSAAESEPGSKVQLAELFAEYDAHGHVVGKVTDTLSFQMPQSNQPVAYSRTIRQPAGAIKLRVALQDKASGRTGVLTMPLDTLR